MDQVRPLIARRAWSGIATARLVGALAAALALAGTLASPSVAYIASGSGYLYTATPANAIDELSCTAKRLCVGVDYYGRSRGDVVTSTEPAGTWKLTRLAHPVFDVSCAPEGLCVATDGSGDVLTSTNPTGGKSAWRTRRVRRADGFRGLSCPTNRFCVGVDASGNVVSSTDPRGGPRAWRTTTRVSRNLSIASCPNPRFCVIAGQNGIVASSTDPTGGARAWRVVHVHNGANYLDDISCPTRRLCVTVGYLPEVITSTDPTGGANAWKITHLEGANYPLLGVSCASPRLCAAIDSGGEVLTSTHPTEGASAWGFTGISIGAPKPPAAGLTAVSCASVVLCVLGDSQGDALVSADPAALAPKVGSPAVSGTIAGVARRRARLTFTTTAGRNARGIERLRVGLPRGLRFSVRGNDLTRGLGVRIAGGRRLQFSTRINGGTLAITLKRTASRVQVTITAPAIVVSQSLVRHVGSGQVKTLTFVVRPMDAAGVTTRLKLVLRA